jgi:hypothetical protein
MKFNVVVGKSTRRTPSKRDLIEDVILNPTWTIPKSILKKDKLAKIQSDMDYLKNHRIRVLDSNKVEYNSLDIDWNLVNPDSFPYDLVQQPGINNSLGVVKFPLYKYSDNIYMHDTNEKVLFGSDVYNRHKSSGCVRLEKPLEFDAHILKSTTDGVWNLETLKSLVPPVRAEKELITYELKSSMPLPVYLIYLTVDVGDRGQIRFHDDIYGQDSRFLKVLNSEQGEEQLVEVSGQLYPGETNSIGLSSSESSSLDLSSDESTSNESTLLKTGSLLISGEAGSTQYFSYVKAIPCKEVNGVVQRATCRIEKAVAISLNVESQLPYGPYILGFENSLYPGFVRIGKKVQKINLEKIKISDFEVKRNSELYRVVRDFSEHLEKSKNSFQTYFVQQPIFNLAQYGFGGLYLKGSFQKDVSSRLSYRACSKSSIKQVLSDEAKTFCNNAKVDSLVPTKEFFSVNKVDGKADGTFTEKWINEDIMDVVEVKHPYHLVATPLKFDDFVSVFSGSYRVIDEDGKVIKKITSDLKKISSEYKMLFIDYEDKGNDESDHTEDQNI